jgi:hypothetical protein
MSEAAVRETWSSEPVGDRGYATLRRKSRATQHPSNPRSSCSYRLNVGRRAVVSPF